MSNKCFNCGDEFPKEQIARADDAYIFGYCNYCWHEHLEAMEAEYTLGGTIVTVALTAVLIIAVGTVLLNLAL